MKSPLKEKPDAGDLSGELQVSTPKTRATAEGGTQKGHFYKPWPKRFQAGGFDYRQIHRESDFAVYQQTWKGNGHSVAFEVIRIRRHEGFPIGGRFVGPAEIYPKAKDWGTDGWTLQDEEAAFRKLREIIASPNARTRFGQQEVEQ